MLIAISSQRFEYQCSHMSVYSILFLWTISFIVPSAIARDSMAKALKEIEKMHCLYQPFTYFVMLPLNSLSFKVISRFFEISQ